MAVERMGASPFMVGGEGGSTFVNGDQLKQADVPIDTLLGAANGAVMGAVVSSGVSGLVTVAKAVENKQNLRGIGATVIHNIVGNHLVQVLSGTAAVAILGALVRNSRARKHNEWTEKHYAYLEQQNGVSHTDRETARKDTNQGAAQGM